MAKQFPLGSLTLLISAQAPLPSKVSALSARVSPQTLDFRLLDETPLSGLERVPLAATTVRMTRGTVRLTRRILSWKPPCLLTHIHTDIWHQLSPPPPSVLDTVEHSDLPLLQSSLEKETYQFSIALRWGKRGACLYSAAMCHFHGLAFKRLFNSHRIFVQFDLSSQLGSSESPVPIWGNTVIAWSQEVCTSGHRGAP